LGTIPCRFEGVPFDGLIERTTAPLETNMEPIMMRRHRLALVAVTVAASGAAPVALRAQGPLAKPDTSGYVAANGVDY
jgi:hypothetical protein